MKRTPIETFHVDDNWQEECGLYLSGRSFGCGCCSSEYKFQTKEDALAHMDAAIERAKQEVTDLKVLRGRVKNDTRLLWGEAVGLEWLSACDLMKDGAS